MPEPVIRRATRDDLPSLGRLATLLVQEHYEFDARRFLEPGPETARHYAAFLGTQLEDHEVVLLVAEQDGTAVGYAFGAKEGYDYMSLRGPAGVLHDLVVDPGYRGRGIGRLLLDEALAHLASLGAPRVVLSTAERNAPAQRLFARRGFRRTMVEMTCELTEVPSRGKRGA